MFQNFHKSCGPCIFVGILHIIPVSATVADRVTLLNKDHCMARWSESKANSGLIVQSDGIAR